MGCGHHPNIFAADSLFPGEQRDESAGSARRSNRNHRILRNLQCSVNLVFCIGAITNRDLDVALSTAAGGCNPHFAVLYLQSPDYKRSPTWRSRYKWLLDVDKSGPLLDTAFSLVFVSLKATCQRPIILSSC
jgi:hypothetical protein